MTYTTNYTLMPTNVPASVDIANLGDQYASDIAHLADGSSVALYYTNSPAGPLFLRKITAAGAPVGGEVIVTSASLDASGYKPGTMAVLSNGNIVVTWADALVVQGLHYRIFDSSLNPQTGVQSFGLPLKSNIVPTVAALTGGGFVITYERIFLLTDDDIFAQRFDNSGTAVGSLISVNASSSTLDDVPAVAGLADGGFAIAHQRNSAGLQSIWRSVWNADGSVRTADSSVDSLGAVNQNVAVAALPTGGFDLFYEDSQFGGAQTDISSFQFSASGTPGAFRQSSKSGMPDIIPRSAVSPEGLTVTAYVAQRAGGLAIAGFVTDLSGNSFALDSPLDASAGGHSEPAVVWIDNSHIAFVETVTAAAAGNDGAGLGVAVGVAEVARVITGDNGGDSLNFGASGLINHITEGNGNNFIIGGSSANTIQVGSGINTVYGGAGNDVFIGTGTGGSDVFVGLGGVDQFYGGSGNNYIVGGAGTNTIVGGAGNSQSLYSYGTSGDYIVGGNIGAAGVNAIVEDGTSAAQLWGEGVGENYIVGGAANDLLVGGQGLNYLFGGAGDDTLYGGQATNYIYGGAGNDFIWTDPVGAQSTSYIYEGGGTGVDTIADFTIATISASSHDVLVISPATGITNFAQAIANTTQQGVYSVVNLGNGDSVFIYNVQPFQLSAADFLFF